MSRDRWLLSALIVFHLAAVTSHLLPSPNSLALAAIADRPEPVPNAVSRALAPPLDRAASLMFRTEPVLFRATAPVRQLTQPYIAAGLRQYWAMFANPEFHTNYARLDYYVADAGGRLARIDRELVFPEGRDDQAQLATRFLDKAAFTAVNAFHRPDDPESIGAGAVSSDFRSMIRYFQQRYQSRNVGSGEHVGRVDFWYGSAPIAPPYAAADLEPRLDALRGYYPGLIPISLTHQAGSVGTKEREADITWTLEFIDIP